MAPMSTEGSLEERFHVVIGPTAPADAYLVDTQTGASWQRMDDPKTHEAYFGAIRVQPAQPPIQMPGAGRLR